MEVAISRREKGVEQLEINELCRMEWNDDDVDGI